MPVCVVCALLGCLWVGGGGGDACGVVCCLVPQVQAGTQWAPDAKPAGGVFGADTPPPRQPKGLNEGQIGQSWLFDRRRRRSTDQDSNHRPARLRLVAVPFDRGLL